MVVVVGDDLVEVVAVAVDDVGRVDGDVVITVSSALLVEKTKGVDELVGDGANVDAVAAGWSGWALEREFLSSGAVLAADVGYVFRKKRRRSKAAQLWSKPQGFRLHQHPV